MNSAIRAGAMALLALWVAPGVAQADICDELRAKACSTASDVGACAKGLDARLLDRDGARLTGEPRAKACRKLLDEHRKLTAIQPKTGRLERVLIGRWRVDIEGSMALYPELQALPPDDRKLAIELLTDQLGGVSLEFAAGRRVISRPWGDEKHLTYRVVEQGDDAITIELIEPDRTSQMTFTVRGNQLQLLVGKSKMLLQRE